MYIIDSLKYIGAFSLQMDTEAAILDLKMATKVWIQNIIENGILTHILFWQIFEEQVWSRFFFPVI